MIRQLHGSEILSGEKCQVDPAAAPGTATGTMNVTHNGIPNPASRPSKLLPIVYSDYAILAFSTGVLISP
jgi:hypothetical protein